MLLRHAKSDWSAAGQPDHARPLAARGRKTAPAIGRYMAREGLIPAAVRVSNARRTRETWELVRAALGPAAPDAVYDPRIYDASPATLLGVIWEAGADAHPLLLVGHNPGLHELARRLTADARGNPNLALAAKFPTAALAVIDFPLERWSDVGAGRGRLERFVTPRSLKPGADAGSARPD